MIINILVKRILFAKGKDEAARINLKIPYQLRTYRATMLSYYCADNMFHFHNKRRSARYYEYIEMSVDT